MAFAPDDYIRTILVGLGVLLLSILLMEVATIPAIVIDPSILTLDPDTSRIAVLVFLPLNFIGMAIAGFVYLRLTGRGYSWLDLRRPTKRDAIWIVGGSILAIAVLLIGGILSQVFETEVPDSPLMELIEGDVMLLSYMLVTVWLFNAPAEEFVFRNIIQKRSYAAFSGAGAVIFASLLFALVHLPAYLALGAEPVDLVIPGSILFIGSIIMGLAYLRTRNLWVPIIIHATYNSVQIGVLLLAALLGIDATEATATIVVFLG